MADDRRRKGGKGDDYSEIEVTIPNRAPPSRTAPRIATPLVAELKPTPSPPKGLPPIRPMKTTQPMGTVPSAPVPAPAPAPAAPASTAIERPVTPSIIQQAAHAASMLAQSSGFAGNITIETVAPRGTLASPAPMPSPSELVRVIQQQLQQKISPRLTVLTAPDSAMAASFRVLRHRLTQPGGPKVTLVTSPRTGEGKTTCAVNLALAMGEAGRARVLLLELNFRRPALARLLGFRPPICFSEQVEFHRAQPMQPWIVVENVSPWLHTAAVSADLSARPLLDGPAVALCLDQLRGAGYDHIVVDSPAVLGSADVNLIEASVDGILMVLSARRSHARALRKAIDQIGKEKVVGVALMGS